MKYLKQYMIIGAVTMITSCSDFLDTAPLDALSPATTWKTEDDAQKFAIGCYGGNNYDTSSWERWWQYLISRLRVGFWI